MSRWPKDHKKQTKEERAAYKKKYRQDHPHVKAYHNEYSKKYNAAMRLEYIELFGGKCVHCGESDSIVLDFDHINNDGYKDKRKNMIVWSVKKNPEKFQLLCRNCNWRKEYWTRKEPKD